MFENIMIIPIYIMLVGGGFFFLLASIAGLVSEPFINKA